MPRDHCFRWVRPFPSEATVFAGAILGNDSSGAPETFEALQDREKTGPGVGRCVRSRLYSSEWRRPLRGVSKIMERMKDPRIASAVGGDENGFAKEVNRWLKK